MWTFVEPQEPFIVKEHADLRVLSLGITNDTDALLVDTYGVTPLVLRTIKRYGLPIIRDTARDTYLRVIRVKIRINQ